MGGLFGGFPFGSLVLLLLLRLGQTFDEDDCGRSAVHAAALMRSSLIVALHVDVENGLHLLDRFEPGAPAFDTEVLVEQGAMQPLDYAVRLRALDPRRAVLNLLELQEQLIGVLIRPYRRARGRCRTAPHRSLRRWPRGSGIMNRGQPVGCDVPL